jgi:hypothetical protein
MNKDELREKLVTARVDEILGLSNKNFGRKKEGSAWTWFGLFFLALVVSSWEILVIWKLYGWFLVPLGFRITSYLFMIGVFQFASLTKEYFKPVEPKNTPEEYVKQMTTSVFLFGVGLVLAWLLHLGAGPHP